MEFARIAGANVIAWDVNQRRLEFCTIQLKISYAINPSSVNGPALLNEITRGDMPGVVIDATGSLNAIENGFRLMSHGGRYVLVGLQRENISFSHPEFHAREGTLMSSRNATRSDFTYVIDSLRSRLLDPAAYITHRGNFYEMMGQFERWLDPKSGVIKAVMEIH
jgi:threonine dehydrogenase-like Zn-dependent dehydrogenase